MALTDMADELKDYERRGFTAFVVSMAVVAVEALVVAVVWAL